MTRLSILYAAGIAVLVGHGCGVGKKAVMVKGSDTMVNLVMAWAEGYGGAENRDALVGVTGGGSGTGIASLINGSTDIAMCSRTIKKQEIEQARQNKVFPCEFLVALDGIAVVVHPENQVDKLTLKELSGIFRGKIRNWKELGGADAAIVVLSREVNSGTHIFFKEAVLWLGKKDSKEEFGPEVLLLPSSQAIADEVAGNRAAIGYIGMGYISPKHRVAKVAKDDKSPPVAPTTENVVSKRYPISRPLLFYTNGKPLGRVKEFLDFVQGSQGQEIVVKEDFVPVTAVELPDRKPSTEPPMDANKRE